MGNGDKIKIVVGGQSKKDFTENDFDKSCIDKNKLDRILLKTPFEDEAEAIFSAVLKIHTGDVKTEEKVRRGIYDYHKKNKELAEALLLTMNDSDIKLVGKRYDAVLPQSAIKEIQGILMKEYKGHLLNYTPATLEDGYDLLDAGDKFLCDSIDEYFEIKYGTSRYDNSFHWESRQIDDSIMNEVIDGWEISREIDKQQITAKIIELDEFLSNNKAVKVGRPIENIKIYAGVLVFMQAKGYEGNSSIYKVIFDYLDTFHLVPEEVKEGWRNKVEMKGKYFYPEVSYIKSYCRKAIKYKLTI